MLRPTRTPSEKEIRKYLKPAGLWFFGADDDFSEEYIEYLRKDPVAAVLQSWRTRHGRTGLSAAAIAGIFGEKDVVRVLHHMQSNTHLKQFYCRGTGLGLFRPRTCGDPLRLDDRHYLIDENAKRSYKHLEDKFSAKSQKPTVMELREYGGHPVPKRAWDSLKKLAKLYACR